MRHPAGIRRQTQNCWREQHVVSNAALTLCWRCPVILARTEPMRNILILGGLGIAAIAGGVQLRATLKASEARAAVAWHKSEGMWHSPQLALSENIRWRAGCIVSNTTGYREIVDCG